MKIDKIMEQFFDFTDGIRVLMLMHRKKEGGNDRNKHCLKRISRNREDFEHILNEFKEIIEKSKIPYRIYSTVNERCIRKAIKVFKINQVNAEYEKDNDFYVDISNRFISALMQPESKAEKCFMIDLDTKEEVEVEKLEKILYGVVGRNLFKYETKNGFHFIAPPFDVRSVSGYSLNKDGLILLYF